MVKRVSKAIGNTPQRAVDAVMGPEYVRAGPRAKMPTSALYVCRMSVSMFCTVQCSTSLPKTVASRARCLEQYA
eukprot:7510763-Pyramimonas_sp.AAC.3